IGSPVLLALQAAARIPAPVGLVDVALLLRRPRPLLALLPPPEHGPTVPAGRYTEPPAGRIRLVAQDTALSRRRHGFESRMRLQRESPAKTGLSRLRAAS